MTQQEKITYESLKISDKRYNNNEAEKYMNEVKSRYEKKETVQDYMKTDINGKELKYFWTTVFIIFYVVTFTLFFTIGFSEYTLMKSYKYDSINYIGIIILTIDLFITFIFWFYSIISILKNDFRKDIDKVAWLIGTIFIPFIFIIYLDYRNIKCQ